MKLNGKRIYCIFVVAFACVVLYFTSQLDSLFSPASTDVGPKFFPRAAAIGLILCAVGKFITEGNPGKPVFEKEGWKKIALIFVILAGYLLTMTVFGYIIATPIFSAILVIAMKEDRKIKPLRVILFSIILTAVLYLVFVKLILVFLPEGILFS